MVQVPTPLPVIVLPLTDAMLVFEELYVIAPSPLPADGLAETVIVLPDLLILDDTYLVPAEQKTCHY
jgi:hypothetical protein